MMDEHTDHSGSTTSTELSARRTGMSFQRIWLSADRTLMSVIRRSLSLFSFGFTIYSFFQKVRPTELGTHGARNFGVAKLPGCHRRSIPRPAIWDFAA